MGYYANSRLNERPLESIVWKMLWWKGLTGYFSVILAGMR
jgi:hypothetical protein